jgi:hypothetical protein
MQLTQREVAEGAESVRKSLCPILFSNVATPQSVYLRKNSTHPWIPANQNARQFAAFRAAAPGQNSMWEWAGGNDARFLDLPISTATVFAVEFFGDLEVYLCY